MAAMLLGWFGLLPLLVQAELSVQISQGVEGGIPVAIVPFAGQESLGGENIGAIVAADLARTGRFNVLPVGQLPERPSTPDQVQFGAWQSLGLDAMAIGQIKANGGGQYIAEFHLLDAVRGAALTSMNLSFSQPELRKTAHRIADIIYQQLTGQAGSFATKVAFVAIHGRGADRQYRLNIADTDGQNAQSVITFSEPIMSPSWSPDGRKIAYVSFENKTAAIYVQNLATGEREKVSESPGINGAPAWSPDGNELAMTLSKDGNPDVYVMNLASRSLRRITDNLSIDTEPSWSKDGNKLLFTSDRGGKPQLYLVSAEGGSAQRLTYEGDYNARGVFSPDGKSIAMVHGVGGSYRIGLMDLASRDVRVLTKGPQDESPGFAPNGSMILYASGGSGSCQLNAVSIDGKVRQPLRIEGGEVRQPAWSP